MVAHTCTRAQNVSVPTYLYLIHAVDGFIQNFFAMDKIAALCVAIYKKKQQKKKHSPQFL